MNNEVVSQRLRAALDEQARLSLRYDESIGTTYELTAYARLQAATLAVSNCERVSLTPQADGHRSTG
jgi:hypothetical protein